MIAEGTPTPTTLSRLDIQRPLGIERILTLRSGVNFFYVLALVQTLGLRWLLASATVGSLRRVTCGGSFSERTEVSHLETSRCKIYLSGESGL